MWVLFAVLSAIFAALTSILAKVGIEGGQFQFGHGYPYSSSVGNGLGHCAADGTLGGISAITTRGWIFLVLSGLATGASWLCYYYALQIGDASRVVPIDKFSVVITMCIGLCFPPRNSRLENHSGGRTHYSGNANHGALKEGKWMIIAIDSGKGDSFFPLFVL